MVGVYEKFLTDGSRLKVEFFGEEPIDVLLSETAEAVVASTGAPTHETDAAPKTAKLDNGMEVLVPQFIKNGDRIKLDVASGAYKERVTR
jgi:elongation factor P